MRIFISLAVLNIITIGLFMVGCAEPMPIRANYLPVEPASSWSDSQSASLPGELDESIAEESSESRIDSRSIEKKPDTVLYEPEDGLDFISPPVLIDFTEMSEGFDILAQKNTRKTCVCPNGSSIQPVVYTGDTKKPKTQKQSKKPLSGVVNINTAPVETLILLPGIGPSLAERIVEYRTKRKFGQTMHLRRVKGIGRSKFDKLKEYVVINGETTLTR